MNRRSFLVASLATSAVALASQASGQSTFARFHRAWRSVPDRGIAQAPMSLVAGTMPEDLVGTYFLNGPAKHERGGQRYEHWFDGDGMLNAFRFDGQSATHEARYVETSKFQREREAGRFLYPSFDTVPRDPLGISGPDDTNTANISVIERGGELWALWEGGSPHRIDPSDLSTKGKVVLAEGFEGAPFSAHPRRARDGTLWAYGFNSFAGRLVLSEIAPDGTMRRFKVLNGFPHSMVHDFVTTEKHIIVGFPPYTISQGGDAYLDHFRWHPQQARLYVVISKETFEVVRRYEADARFQFHHFGGFEEADGTIHFAACSYDNASWVETEARSVMDGEPFTGLREGMYERITLRPDGKILTELSGSPAEFPVGDPRLAEMAQTQFSISRSSPDNRISNAIVARSPSGELIDRWDADISMMMGEHIVVPRANGGSYLIGNQFDAAKGRMLIALFDSSRLAAGPLAVWQPRQDFPAPLHGVWVA